LPNAPVAGGFLTVENTGAEDDRLIAARSPVAGHMEVHEMRMQGDVMKMHEVEGGLPIPAGETVTLKPGGYHVMFLDLQQPLGRGDCQLVTTDGQPFTFATQKGTPSAVFFGYTHCPDVCPTTLGDVAAWQEALAQEGKQLQVFFMTVDPERDTVAVLKDYVSWVPGVTGVTGSRTEVDKAIQSFRIYAQKVGAGDDGYFMDHTATMLTFDAKGRLAEPISYQEDYDRALSKIRHLLAEKTNR
jgi:protein SCO1